MGGGRRERVSVSFGMTTRGEDRTRIEGVGDSGKVG
jgi:hypothetical protein